VEVRWRRLALSGVTALTLLGGAGTVIGASGDPWWDPPACAGGPATITEALRDGPTVAGPVTPIPWAEIAPVIDNGGALAGQRVTVGVGAAQRRLALPPESFVAGPFGRVVLVGADDGQRSRLRLVDVAAACAWDLADEAAVIRRATVTPDRTSVLEMRVDRVTRADLGIWRRPTDRPGPPRRILPPVAIDGRFGRTFSTEFTWSVDGDRVAIQSCGATACRTRLLDPTSGRSDLVDDPDLGSIVGLARDRLVVYRACRGLPCPLFSLDTASHARSVVSWAAGPAAVTGRGAAVRIVHEWRDGLGFDHVRSVDDAGEHPLDLGRSHLDPAMSSPESSR